MSWVAYVDESMRADAGVYVLAAAVLDISDEAEAREAVAGLTASGPRFHWRHESEKVQRRAVEAVCGLAALHVVVVGAPLNLVKQERARRHCLRHLLFHLDVADVRQVWMEARTISLNSRDIAAVRAFRASHVIGHNIRVDHRYPLDEPLLWLPDIVAGAIGMAEGGDPRYREQLADILTEHRIRFD